MAGCVLAKRLGGSESGGILKAVIPEAAVGGYPGPMEHRWFGDLEVCVSWVPALAALGRDDSGDWALTAPIP
jgi:hypothetical protein